MTQTLIGLFLLLIYSFGVGAEQHSKSSGYSMQDLQVLEQNKDYREFLNHAMDIRPRDRISPWGEMVQSMATGYLDFLTQRNDFEKETFDYLEQLTRWPSLRDDEFFHLRWQRYGLRSIRHCIKRAYMDDSHKTSHHLSLGKCYQQLKRFWHSTPKNPDLGIQVAQIVEQIRPGSNLWPYYQYSAKSYVVASLYCQRADIKRWAFRELHEQLTSRNLHGKQLKEVINQNLHADCWNELQGDLKRILYGPRPQQISAFLLLEAKDELETTEKDFFLTRYLLEGPKVGRLFNLAWNQLQEMSTDFKRRQAVLDRLLSLDPLPGVIFSGKNSQQREVLLDHLSATFPEYLESYARTCLDYMEGKREFPRGNPTIECQELFMAQQQQDRGKKWLDQHLRIRYSSQVRAKNNPSTNE